MRIGHGFDVHAFEEGDNLVLGGVHIPFHKKFKAHSDGDVLIHAVCDSLLGAAALGDIGQHFPDTDDHFRNIDSRVLLREVKQLLDRKSLSVSNVDITIIAQKPRLQPFIEQMKNNLSEDIKLNLEQVNIKATTTEGLGYTGRGEGVAVHSVCLLQECS